MKRILLSASIGAVIVAANFQTFSRSEAARTPQSYPLVCRGAASLEMGSPEPDSWEVGFTFTRGTKPAGEGLAPGQCSWVDRAMHVDEPDRLYQNVEGEEFPPGKKPWFLELHSPDKYWTFMVSNQLSKYGWRQLTATSARPLEFTVNGYSKIAIQPRSDQKLSARLPGRTESGNGRCAGLEKYRPEVRTRSKACR